MKNLFETTEDALRINGGWKDFFGAMIATKEMGNMTTRTFNMPTTVHIGVNAAAEVGPAAARQGASRALLVTDQILIDTGTIEPVFASLRQAGIPVEIYAGVDKEPTLTHVEDGLDIIRRGRCDLVIGCGGGSSLDVAKAVSVMATNPGVIQQYMGADKVRQKGLPLFAVPTTAGTGSEATMFTIITDSEHDVKMLIGSPYLMPQVAFVDPGLTMAMPRGLTAATGLDALTHAIEAYVSRKAQPMTDVLALSAVGLIYRNLPKAWQQPDDLEARSQTMLGAFQAGIAFSNASVALVHGMSRPVGALFHVPHGISNAALLGVVMEFSLSGNPKRYADIARAMGVDCPAQADDATVAQAGADAVKGLIAALKVPGLQHLGVSREKLDPVVAKMAEDALASGSPGNNPRLASKQEIIELYYAAL